MSPDNMPMAPPNVPSIPAMSSLAQAYSQAADIPENRRLMVAEDVVRFLQVKPDAAGLFPHLPTIMPILNQMVREAARLGFTPKRAKNIRSSVRAAIQWAREAVRGRRARTDLMPEYAGLIRLIDEISSRIALHAFFGWLSGRSTMPDQVTDAELLAYRRHLDEDGVAKSSVSTRIRATVRTWNIAADCHSSWPQIRLTMPPRAGNHVLLEAFSPAFRDDLASYMANGLQEHGSRTAGQPNGKRFSTKPTTAVRKGKLRKATAEGYLHQARIGAQYLARATSKELHEILSLSELVKPGAPEIILEEMYRKLGNSQSLRIFITAIRDIANFYVAADVTVIDEINILFKQTPKQIMKMAEKSRLLLHRLSSEDLSRLYGLPNKLQKAVDRRLAKQNGRPTDLDIQEGRVAVALDFLLYTPPRIHNLCMIDLDDHLHIPLTLGHSGRLSFSSDDMKGKANFSVPVRPEALRRVAWYRTALLSKMATAGAREKQLLFPGRDPGTTLAKQSMRKSLCDVVQSHIGIRLHPHFYRDLVAHIILVRHPTALEPVAALLGHADTRTTKKYYASEAAQAALHHLARWLDQAACLITKGDFDPSIWTIAPGH